MDHPKDSTTGPASATQPGAAQAAQLSAAAGDMLVCDLDGTLIRTDMLFETFWAAFGTSWRAPFQALRGLLAGRAALKARLSDIASVDAATLPYEPAVLDRLRDWRAAGGRTALVTASDQRIADGVAAHLGLFDEAHGSDGRRNLKGAEKARFLNERYGRGRYAYAGDSSADLHVWADAGEAITVAAPVALRRKAEALAPDISHIDRPGGGWGPMIRALRPHQWLKNVLIFLPFVTAHHWGGGAVLTALLAFAAFSLVASSVYVLNDLLDLANDRVHPRKCRRPFASGDLPLKHGTWLAPALLGGGVALAICIGPQFLSILAVYYVATTAYSFWLKKRAIVDICTLAGLYTLRIVAGGAAGGIPISEWLVTFSGFFFFALAAVKRQAELVDNAATGTEQPAGRGYHVDDRPLIAMMAVASGYVSVLVMALYVDSDAVRRLYSEPTLLWGICGILLFWISRIVLTTHRGQMHDDPVVFAARDRVSLVSFAGILGFFALANYL
ncbi:UbiA family prenyltransferase [Pseudooceanicola aestuarii]|uniref:UbiA family prenyltransferase n=1 Tax=Pseudooceanicola aestuarii TaxID=2697319 RepID=UPI001EF9AC01|nr:UbiA family prenyltransferase [Pseudooceanicola aestuarii]